MSNGGAPGAPNQPATASQSAGAPPPAGAPRRKEPLTAGAPNHDALINGLVTVVNKVDPKSPDADKIIAIVDAVVPMLDKAEQSHFIAAAKDGLDGLLGRYGFRTVSGRGTPELKVGDLQRDRLEYALGNFRKLTPKQRDDMRRDPTIFSGMRHGFQMLETGAERWVKGEEVVMQELSDGSFFQGTVANRQIAEEQIRINHAWQQIEGIRNAGVSALIGRIIGGEKGAEIGAMLDTGLMALAPARARQSIRAQQNTGVGSTRGSSTPIEPLGIRARAPARTAMPKPDAPMVPQAVARVEGWPRPPKGHELEGGIDWRPVELPAGTKLYALGAPGKKKIPWGAFQETDLLAYVQGNQWTPKWARIQGESVRTKLVEYEITIKKPLKVWASKVADQPVDVALPGLGGRKIQYWHPAGLGIAVEKGTLGIERIGD